MFIRFFSICALLFLSSFASPLFLAHAEEEFLQLAIPLAQASQRETSVPASVTLAQAVWETGRGKSPIGAAKNYFGIKAGSSTSESVTIGPIATGWVWALTQEWDGKKYVERRERFRKYDSMADSFRDHGLLLAASPRYANAMRAVDDPREFARRIAAAGYATSPTYARDLIGLMDAENLYQHDLPRNAMELVTQSEPLQVNAGDIFQIYFEIKNIGFGTWSPTADYHLASANENRFSANPRQELDQLVSPERAKRWAITMIAPNETGTYESQWQFKHGAASVGAAMSAQIKVKPSPMPQMFFLIGGVCVFMLGTAGGLLWFGYRRWEKIAGNDAR